MNKKDRKFKHFSAEIKAKEDSRVITAIGSSSNVDRDKEIVSVKGMDIKKYKENPVLLWAHDNSGLPIGRANKVTKTKDGELKFELEFADVDVNPFADSVFKLYKAGFLNSFSIGFLPDYTKTEYDEKNGVVKFNKSELLELSCVNCPANPDARVITRSLINEAVSKSVIDEAEAKDFEITLKDEYGIDLDEKREQSINQDDVSVEKEVEPEPDMLEVLTKKVETLEARIKELEGQNNKEVDSDSYFDELLQYVSDEKSKETDTDDQLAKSLLDELNL